MDKRIYLCLAHMSGKEQGFIKEAFDTNWVVPLGPNVNAFEEELESFIGNNKKVVALSAGTAAIHLALIQLGFVRVLLSVLPPTRLLIWELFPYSWIVKRILGI